ncbi:hypothetical protein BLNAU_20277 [Blattamonas nauphoetae]|uniref:Uncharacterized protein n=1 Tax=Blattamonas nauphoetae TaxID=2049346 RepID=A0ABQ9WZ72_9EUKA|nr:hypothetical protein BLNAU_20277 [Blattamonas nauphoetae]
MRRSSADREEARSISEIGFVPGGMLVPNEGGPALTEKTLIRTLKFVSCQARKGGTFPPTLASGIQFFSDQRPVFRHAHAPPSKDFGSSSSSGGAFVNIHPERTICDGDGRYIPPSLHQRWWNKGVALKRIEYSSCTEDRSRQSHWCPD